MRPAILWAPCVMALLCAVTPDLHGAGLDKLRPEDFLLPLLLIATTGWLYVPALVREVRLFPLSRCMAVVLLWDLFALLHSHSDWLPGFWYLCRRASGFLLAWASFRCSARDKLVKCVGLSIFLLAVSILADAAQKFRIAGLLTRDQLKADGLLFLGQEVPSALIMVAGCCLALAFWQRSRQKPLLGSGLVLAVTAVLCSGNRSVTLALLVAFGWILLAAGKRRPSFRLIALLLVCACLLAPAPLRSRVWETGEQTRAVLSVWTQGRPLPEAETSSLSNRLQTAHYTLLERISPAWMTGNGTGQPPLGMVDNFYLTEWSYHGLVGLVLYLLLLGQVWRKTLALRHRDALFDEEASLALAVQGFLLAALVSGLTADTFFLARPMALFWLLCGALYPQPESPPAVVPSLWRRGVPAALLLAAILPGLYGLSLADVPTERGVNDAGAEFGGAENRFKPLHLSSPNTLRYISQCRLRLVRLPVAWESLQPELYGPLDPTVVSQLRNYLKAAEGLDVILDIHNFGRYRDSRGNTVVLGGPGLPISAFADLWSRLAREFQSDPWYAYDLMNEPHDMQTQTWKEASQAALDAIRGEGDRRRIFVAGSNWSSAKLWRACHGPVSWIRDPANNFAYEAHCYFDASGGGTYPDSYFVESASDPAIAARPKERLQPFLDWCVENNVQGFIGEMGCPPEADWCSLLDTALTELDRAHMPVTLWALGDRWPTDYNLLMQPSDGTTHRPQMEVLLRHANSTPGAWNDWKRGYRLVALRLRFFLRRARDAWAKRK